MALPRARGLYLSFGSYADPVWCTSLYGAAASNSTVPQYPYLFALRYTAVGIMISIEDAWSGPVFLQMDHKIKDKLVRPATPSRLGPRVQSTA